MFKVLYCAKTEPNRHWPFEPSTMHHDFEILSGFHPNLKNIYPHINLSILRRLKKLSPKLIICAGSWNLPTVMIAATKRVTKAPIYFWSEGHNDAVRNPTGVIAFVRKYIINQFDGFLVPNAKSNAWITQQLTKTKPLIKLPNTVDENFFINAVRLNSSTERSDRNIPDNHCVFLQVSQLEDKKGVLELANSFLTEHNDQLSNSTLVFVGTGSLIAPLKKIAQQSNGTIKVIGQQTMEQVRAWLKVADWFVLNTKQDPNPLTPIEASFTATPSILSIKAGNFNEICKGNNGIAIEDTNAPTSALITAKNTTAERYREISSNVYKNAIDHFSREVVINHLLAELTVFTTD